MREKGGGTPPERSELGPSDVAQLWAKFRAGEVVKCPKDTSSIALSVDGTAKAYRLVCTLCGLASPWFGTSPSGIVIRGPSSTMSPGPNPDE